MFSDRAANMLHLGKQLLGTGILLLLLVMNIHTESQECNEFDCMLTDLKTRLSVATEIIDTAKGKLPINLKETCRKITCDEKPTDPIEIRRNSIQEHNCKNIARVVRPMDCSDIYQEGNHTSGPYEIWPQSRISKGPLDVYCDMDDGSGWTIIQRRGDFGNSEDYFYKTWDEYKSGFGDILKEYWIGNDNIFILTNQRSYELRVDLTDFKENFKYATYSEFWIEDESRNYTLHVSGYSGTAGDSLQYHNDKPFSTKDRDNPNDCAVRYSGAWWYHSCHYSNLNGPYFRDENATTVSICWKHFKRDCHPLKDTVMKIRPADFA